MQLLREQNGKGVATEQPLFGANYGVHRHRVARPGHGAFSRLCYAPNDDSKPAAVCARAMPNFGRGGSRQSIEPKAVLEHRAPKTSPPILHSRGVESKVGRAVHCAPEPLALAQPIRLGFCFPRPYGRGYEPVICWCGKNTLLILHPAGRGLPALPAIGF